ncbi:MarR family winged helix-turn-helix transcriptional regulator [Jiulongibacter sediminis]|jgi:DNA-binding MarR family transcriptional regulator|uniref:MarR family winged helix-turn-helix transcriptional regulator n=1 Tax=Jiulongibacter sediminis TaxID=1605367 RepID=UPI0026EC2502|nr:MarR family winged helix-turn-helix transcriptional regulator [Jiulongibacter sediminis]
MKYEILKELIALSEAYELENSPKEWRREQFIAWLLQSGEKEEGPFKKDDTIPSQDGLIAMFISLLFKYAQFYSKRILKDSPLYSLDDFGMLAGLFPNIELKKTDLIRRSIMEKSSGNEVIKRLLRQGLIAEKNHPDDGRAKLLFLTPEGKAAMQMISGRMSLMSKHVVGNLDQKEKGVLLQMLFKLNEFHKPIFERADEKELHQLFSQPSLN